VPLLVENFVRQLAAGWGRPALRISEGALEALRTRSWPGNVRELRNAVERAVILATADELGPDDFRDEAVDGRPAPAAGATGPVLPPGGLKIDEWTDSLVRQALERTKGNQSAAARLLGMSRDQIRYRMQALGLLGPDGGA
jgi:DNA-binding NtrC family response regulator